MKKGKVFYILKAPKETDILTSLISIDIFEFVF